jgi:hypothetical protein
MDEVGNERKLRSSSIWEVGATVGCVESGKLEAGSCQQTGEWRLLGGLGGHWALGIEAGRGRAAIEPRGSAVNQADSSLTRGWRDGSLGQELGGVNRANQSSSGLLQARPCPCRTIAETTARNGKIKTSGAACHSCGRALLLLSILLKRLSMKTWFNASKICKLCEKAALQVSLTLTGEHQSSILC